MKYKGFNIHFYVGSSIGTFKGDDMDECLNKAKGAIDEHIERLKKFTGKTRLEHHVIEDVIVPHKDTIKGVKIC